MENKCTYDPLAALIAHYSEAEHEAPETVDVQTTSIEERLRRRIIDGDAAGLDKDLDEAREKYTPIAIINGILLDGMQTVGRLFGLGEMQLPFVLQSTEVMKKAVGLLEKHMDHDNPSYRGTMVLATVKGDVHDIGKNLVDIILTNNGYRIIDLGTRVPIETMLSAVREHNANAIGMSGLLVKSTFVMKENLELMESRGLRIPVLLGGAALTKKYVEEDLRTVYHGPLAYAANAFEGLRYLLAGCPEDGRTDMEESEIRKRADSDGQHAKPVPEEMHIVGTGNIPSPPFLGSKAVTEISLDKVYEFINPDALIRGRWHLRRPIRPSGGDEAFIAREILPLLDRLKLEARRSGLLKPAVVHGYFPCNSSGNDLIVYKPTDLDDPLLHDTWPAAVYERGELEEWVRFTFPRQSSGRHLCIADYFAPAKSGIVDVCAFQIVTMGNAAAEHGRALYNADRYQEYLYFHGFSVECTEALAEYWHKSVRIGLGIAGKDDPDMKQMLAHGYQGARYSFGYPACPNLDDQYKLVELLRPERIGVSLTETCQLVPEQSTSAVITHHPDAKWFGV